MTDFSSVARQVSHWIHDEQHCVTVQRLVQTFNLSWADASAILKDVPDEDRQYSVTMFGQGDTNDGSISTATVFQLVKSTWNKDKKPAKDSEWYALALDDCSESIHTSHERDRSQFQEGFEHFSLSSSLLAGKKNGDEKADSECFATSITISEAMKERLTAAPNASASAVAASATAQTMPMKSSFKAPTKKTATTAKDFFGSKGSDSSAKSSNANIKKENKKTTASKPAAKSSQSSTLSFQPKKKEAPTSKKPKKNMDEEKENVQNKKVGDADDFVGDVEDSDDDVSMGDAEESDKDEQEEAPKSKRNTKASKETARNNSKSKSTARRGFTSLDDSEDDDEDAAKPKQTVEGAMDAFAQKVDKPRNNENNGEENKRRRRKVTKEKTYVDAKGYIETRSEEVWEDIPSDEEEPVAAKPKTSKPSPKKKAKKAGAHNNSMKQGNIMGFFKKK